VLDGRRFVLPDDVKGLAAIALAHRLGLRPEVWARRMPQKEIVEEGVGRVPVPRTDVEL